MYKVDSIKKQKVFSIVAGVGTFLLMLLCNSYANMGKHSAAYYWSSDIREGVSALKGVAVLLAILCIIFVSSSIFMFYLDKNGKVCLECKLIYPKSTIKCFKCKKDITYAKSIEEYWAESPVVRRDTTAMSTNMSYPPMQNNAGTNMPYPPMQNNVGTNMSYPPMQNNVGTNMPYPPMQNNAGTNMSYPPMQNNVGINIPHPPMQNNTSSVNREKFCSSCGQKMKGTDRFCPRCGKGN